MDDNEPVAEFLEQAAELAVGVAEERIGVNEYVESIDALKAGLPPESLAEVEVAIQLAAFKMDHEAIGSSDDIRCCYEIAARLARGVIEEIKAARM